MRIRQQKDDPTVLVISTDYKRTSDELDKAAFISKEVAEEFDHMAAVFLEKDVREFPVQKLREITEKIKYLKSLDLDIEIPHSILEVLSTSAPASEFFSNLDTEIRHEAQVLETKKKLFDFFLEHLDKN